MAARNWKDRARSILEDAKKLLGKTSSRQRATLPLASQTAESLSAIDVKVEMLEKRVLALEEEATASYEVVNSIARHHSGLTEQHLELIETVDDLMAANRRLWWACAGLAALALAGLALAIAR